MSEQHSRAKAQVPFHLRNCYSHPLRLSHLVSLFCISPSLLCLLDVISLSLPLSLSRYVDKVKAALKWTVSVIYSLFSYQDCLMWSETSGEWTKRERRRTHGLSHSVTIWCGWRELAAAGSVMCHHQCQWFIMWPEQLLLCKRGKQIASSCAISALGNCYYCAVVDALTRTSINTSLTPRSTEQEDERVKRPNQYIRMKLLKTIFWSVYQCWNFSQSLKLFPSRSFWSHWRTRGVCTDCVTPLGIRCGGPGLTLSGSWGKRVFVLDLCSQQLCEKWQRLKQHLSWLLNLCCSPDASFTGRHDQQEDAPASAGGAGRGAEWSLCSRRWLREVQGKLEVERW